MARYIDADKLSIYFDSLAEHAEMEGLHNMTHIYKRCKQLLDDTPAADVVPKSEDGAECPTCYGTGRIGTTDWLTKNISKEQLAKEKAEAIAEHERHIKQDYAREIFKEIEKHGRKMQSSDFSGDFWDIAVLMSDIAELKKKYTEEK